MTANVCTRHFLNTEETTVKSYQMSLTSLSFILKKLIPSQQAYMFDTLIAKCAENETKDNYAKNG